MEDDSNENIKFHRLERSMEEAQYKFQNVVKAEQQNCGPQKKGPLSENENPDSISKKEHGMEQSTGIQKGVEGQTINVGFKKRSDA